MSLTQGGTGYDENDPPHYAHILQRCSAFLIDSFICSTIPTLLASSNMIRYISGDPEAQNSIFVILQGLIIFIYFTVPMASKYQTTFGGWCVGIRVVDLNYQRISPNRAVGRLLSSILSSLIFGIGYLMVLFTKRKQCLHDMMAKTIVINLNERSVIYYLLQLCGTFVASTAFVIFISMTGLDFDVKKQKSTDVDNPDQLSETKKTTDRLRAFQFNAVKPLFVKTQSRIRVKKYTQSKMINLLKTMKTKTPASSLISSDIGGLHLSLEPELGQISINQTSYSLLKVNIKAHESSDFLFNSFSFTKYSIEAGGKNIGLSGVPVKISRIDPFLSSMMLASKKSDPKEISKISGVLTMTYPAEVKLVLFTSGDKPGTAIRLDANNYLLLRKFSGSDVIIEQSGKNFDNARFLTFDKKKTYIRILSAQTKNGDSGKIVGITSVEPPKYFGFFVSAGEHQLSLPVVLKK